MECFTLEGASLFSKHSGTAYFPCGCNLNKALSCGHWGSPDILCVLPTTTTDFNSTYWTYGNGICDFLPVHFNMTNLPRRLCFHPSPFPCWLVGLSVGWFKNCRNEHRPRKNPLNPLDLHNGADLTRTLNFDENNQAFLGDQYLWVDASWCRSKWKSRSSGITLFVSWIK